MAIVLVGLLMAGGMIMASGLFISCANCQTDYNCYVSYSYRDWCGKTSCAVIRYDYVGTRCDC